MILGYQFMREALACSCYVLLSLGAEPPFERERRLEQRPKYRRPSELLPRVSLIHLFSIP